MKRGFTKKDFYDMLSPNGECLEWTGSLVSTGYGQTKINRKVWHTHRLALELEGFDITGHCVLHSCDNRACCNPKHLRVGTAAENIADRDSKGRQARGTTIHLSKLTEKQVLEIRAITGMKQKDIAVQYGVKPAAINQIINRKTWKHI